MTQTVTRQIGNRTLTLETGRVARQSHGAVLVKYGETVILATVVAKPEVDEGKGYFPLMVDYRERTYAAGKIPGGYFKREGRPSEKEILTSRLIDRPIRPLFPEDYLNEVQVMVTVLSVDGENPSDILAMIGASAALSISDIPFERALGAVRVGLINGEFVLNPTHAQIEESQLDLILAATAEKPVMIEAGAKELSEDKIMEAIRFGHQAIQEVIALQQELRQKCGKPKKQVPAIEIPKETQGKILSVVAGEFEKVFDLGSKEEREKMTQDLYQKVLAQFDPTAPDFKEGLVKHFFEECEKERIREIILGQGRRPDGRGFTDLRQITCEIGVLPRTHGSAIFTRGQTQSLSVTTLGTGEDEQTIDALEGEQSKRFMLHYNFPPFSVGEVGPNRGPGRREIGHGALAERALEAVIPDHDSFPYTIRLVSDILESNGSSSMATVCGGTLSLMDAGVPLKAPVAGIAIGLVTGGNRWKVLTDIAGIEDHLGDMDFKAAGTREGVTAIQMDLKIDGVTDDILQEAFRQAKDARFKILDMIASCIQAPRAQLSAYAPRITMIKINPEKIGMVIGPGGKNIKRIVEETGAKIDINDDGTVSVASTEARASEEAIKMIQAITEEPEIGRIYQGEVRKLAVFGAFCEILPGKDGLCHVSEIADGFVKTPVDYLHVGDVVPVKVIGVDENGKVSLSIKQAKEGGMPMLPPDAERDVISDSGSGRGRGGRGRDSDRGRSRDRSRR
ncbi:MAG: polyribonucleotide nucleotidyltransferase [Candidatus Omnitrophica bacterium]|nr:polyribonucleotide nucleotidyltransferase [Candidatus Omnitrophota bacterium]